MRQDLLVGYIFFSIFAIISLFQILNPNLAITLTIKYFNWVLKLQGFESEIKSTPKAKTRCIAQGVISLCLFIFLLMVLSKLPKR